MPHYDFGLQLEAVKHVGHDGCGRFQLRWFVNDDLKGMSEVCPRVGDEVSFLYSCRFRIETRGVITQLLQLSLLEIPAGESESSDAGAGESVVPNMVGVLMIDLNAHIAKPPKTVSRQRATLPLARCPYDQPVLIRLGLECAPSPTEDLTASPREASTAPRGTSESVSPVPRAPSVRGQPQTASSVRSSSQGQKVSTTPPQAQRIQPGNSTLVGESPFDPALAPAAQLERARALVSSLSSANDQLRDENLLLRRAIDRAREEAESSNQVTSALEGLARDASLVVQSSAEATTFASSEAEGTIAKLRDENAQLRRGLDSAKDSLRQMMDKERELRQQLNQATRAKTFVETELDRATKDLEDERTRGRSTTRDAHDELTTTREMLASSQQMAKDLRAMVHSADTLSESLKRELAAARKDAQDAERAMVEKVDAANSRAKAAEDKAAESAKAVELGQQELNKLHAYCVDMANRLKFANEALSRERTTTRQAQRQLDDLRAVSAAHMKFTSASSERVPAGDGSGIAAGLRSASRHGAPVYTPEYRGVASRAADTSL